MMPAEFVQLGGQGLDGQFRQRLQGRLLGQNQTTGDAKDVRERLNATVGAGFEEEEGGEIALFASQILDEVEAQAGVEAQGQAIRLRPNDLRAVRVGALGNVVSIARVAFMVVGETVFESLDPAGIEQEEFQIAEVEVRIGRELEEEG